VTQSELKLKLEKSFEFLQGELNKVRTGRASPALLEELKVNAYDSKMALKELGSITVPDAQSLLISPWDKSLSDNIAKGIRDSDLNLSPVVDGDLIRVPVPDLTEERRQEMTKLVTAKVEEVKNSIRNIRQEAMKDIDSRFSDKDISEDQKFTEKEDTEEAVKEFTDKAVKLGEDKKSDLLKI
jgi:ribosome recycling factor